VENTFLIVGLGNPGSEYAKTRHNAGFLLVEKLAEHWRANWSLEKKFNARLAKADIVGQASSLTVSGKTPVPLRVLLCEPQTFMNSSGQAVAEVAGFYQVAATRLLVVVDDADLPLGEIRLRPGGSSGGHHGLESIEQHLATREFARLRIGIGRTDGAREITNYVLGKFSATEAALMEKVLKAAADQAECWVTTGIQKAMSRFNGKVEELKS
jgi:PTH1 family peptidyl-tRNA hydrolase